MPKWLRIRENGSEWTITDLRRDYRMCTFNDEKHGGPHVHYPITGPAIAPLGVKSIVVAEQIARAFAKGHDVFGLRSFQRELTKWKS